MNRSHIVHGPTGCGKTRNAERIAAALGLSKVQDNWTPTGQVFEPFDTLYLTASNGPWPDQARHVLSFSEAMGRVPDAVVEPKSRYIHRNGVEYEVVMIANGESTSPKYPPTIVYRGVANGKVWARPACDWDRSMKLVERPDAVEVAVLELEAAGWRNDDPKASVSSVSALLDRIVGALRAENAKLSEALDRWPLIRDSLKLRLADALARVAKLEKELAMARDAAAKGDAARHAAGGMEMEIQELREKVTELQKELRSRWTYASTQATNCAGCGEHKHTPLRVDWMGGYVCLTCIDEKLEELHDDQDQRSVPEGFREKFEQCVELAFAEISYYVSPEKACNPQSRARRASALATELRAMLASSEES